MSESRSQEILGLVWDYFIENHADQVFIPGETYIPVASQTMGRRDLQELVSTCLELRIAAGPKAMEFERKLPAYFGRDTSALLVNSGSSANLIAISALGLKPGDEVITAACGFPTTVNPIIQSGATPVFVDVDLDTLNVRPETAASAVTAKTKAIVLAHTLGNPYRADLMPAGIPLIEDCCDALGAEIQGRRVGSFGDYATCSFYPAHHISMGEGGAVLSATGRLRRVAESFRDWGRDCWCEPGQDNTCKKRFCQTLGSLPCGYDHKYTYSRLGYNLKATELQASLGLTQLEKADCFIAARRRNWKMLRDGIRSSPTLSMAFRPVEATDGTLPSWFGFALHCQNGLNRTQVTQYLESHHVGTRLVFGGNLIKQPAYRDVLYRVQGTLHATDTVMTETFWIGVHPGLSPAHITYMLETLEHAAISCGLARVLSSRTGSLQP